MWLTLAGPNSSANRKEVSADSDRSTSLSVCIGSLKDGFCVKKNSGSVLSLVIWKAPNSTEGFVSKALLPTDCREPQSTILTLESLDSYLGRIRSKCIEFDKK